MLMNIPNVIKRKRKINKFNNRNYNNNLSIIKLYHSKLSMNKHSSHKCNKLFKLLFHNKSPNKPFSIKLTNCLLLLTAFQFKLINQFSMSITLNTLILCNHSNNSLIMDILSCQLYKLFNLCKLNILKIMTTLKMWRLTNMLNLISDLQRNKHLQSHTYIYIYIFLMYNFNK